MSSVFLWIIGCLYAWSAVTLYMEGKVWWAAMMVCLCLLQFVQERAIYASV